MRRLGLAPVMGGGLLLLAGGMAWIARLDVDSGYVLFLVGLLVAGLGIGLTSSTGTSAIVGSLPNDQQGVASAMNDATREVGAAVGVALMGSVYAQAYREALPPAPEAMPHDIVEAIRHSAPAGIEVARRLGDAGEPLAAAVRAAFVDGLSASLSVIAVVTAVSAVVVLVRAPRRSDRLPRPALAAPGSGRPVSGRARARPSAGAGPRAGR